MHSDNKHLTEDSLRSLIQLYPNGCGAEEAADVLQVEESVVAGWVYAGRRLRKGIQYKLALIVGGSNQFGWEGEEEE